MLVSLTVKHATCPTLNRQMQACIDPAYNDNHTHAHTQTLSPTFIEQGSNYLTWLQVPNPLYSSTLTVCINMCWQPMSAMAVRAPTHARIQLMPIRVWLNENYDAYFSIPGSMNNNERQSSRSSRCVCECQRGELACFHAFTLLNMRLCR